MATSSSARNAVSIGCSLGLAVVLGCRRAPAHGPEPADPPDIVLVSIDSLRPDHLGCYGYKKPTSPTIDALARRGVRCDVAITTTSWTLPAHAAMLTGLFDTTHGVADNGLRLSDEIPTLAEVLHAHGYKTAGFFGGPYLDPTYGFDRGFEHYESCMNREATDSHRDVTGPRTVEAVKGWLDRECAPGERRPLFLFIHLWDVHYDYMPPREYVERFDPGYAGSLDGRDFLHDPSIDAHMAPRDFDHLVALYDGEIRFTDENLGRILEAIDRKGRLEKALVLVTADHGEEFFEHGNKGHQRSIFDEVVHVPWVVAWPGHLTAGSIVPDQVRIVDVMPTLFGLAGIAQGPGAGLPPMDGRDVSPLLRGERMEPAPALLELLVDGNQVFGFRTDRSKTITWPKAGVSYRYDLRLDPREEAPIAAERSSEVEAFRALDGAIEAAAAQKTNGRARRVEIGADLRRRLGVLGYTEDAPAGTAGPR